MIVMCKHLSILIIEDSESDAELIIRQFQKADYTCNYKRVETAAQMRAALESLSWDLVIADYNLPQFNAPSALEILQKCSLDIPFIVVSGTIGEETAVEMMKAGAHDYVMKRNLVRLVPVVKRELEEAQMRRRNKEAEKLIKESAEEWITTFDSITDMVSIHDSDFKFLRVNKAYAHAVNMTQEELIGKHCYEVIHGTACPIPGCPHEQTLKTVKSASVEIYEPHLSIYLEISTSPILDRKGTVTGSVHIVKDITSRKQAEEALKSSLREKEILIREIHHRVKNNLSVILGLLDLQSGRIETAEQAVAAFQKSRDRIYSMALVHQRLYEKTDLSSIDMEFYIDDISSKLKDIYAPDRNIIIESNAKGVLLDINRAVPLGLILNELITNSLKYAFPDNREGSITLSLSLQDTSLCLSVADNGIGLPEEIRGDTFGMELIRLLTEQIDGILDIQRDKGTRFTITFPGPDTEE
ncbi:MAG: hypothetical protein C0392_15015 [Syntrophus sp. (in: bacteria)]|nr:hypothetical protein [Syntrophus sp. (in: bacteria)]